MYVQEATSPGRRAPCRPGVLCGTSESGRVFGGLHYGNGVNLYPVLTGNAVAVRRVLTCQAWEGVIGRDILEECVDFVPILSEL